MQYYLEDGKEVSRKDWSPGLEQPRSKNNCSCTIGGGGSAEPRRRLGNNATTNGDNNRMVMCPRKCCGCNDPGRLVYSQCGHESCRRCALMHGDTDLAARAIAMEAIGGGAGNICNGIIRCNRSGCTRCALIDAGGAGKGSEWRAQAGHFVNSRQETLFEPTTRNQGISKGLFGLGGRGTGKSMLTMCPTKPNCSCNDSNRTYFSQCRHEGCARCALEHGDTDKAARAIAAASILNNGGPIKKRCPNNLCSCNKSDRRYHRPCRHDGCTLCALVDAGGAGLGSRMTKSGKPDRFFDGSKTGVTCGPFGLGRAHRDGFGSGFGHQSSGIGGGRKSSFDSGIRGDHKSSFDSGFGSHKSWVDTGFGGGHKPSWFGSHKSSLDSGIRGGHKSSFDSGFGGGHKSSFDSGIGGGNKSSFGTGLGSGFGFH